MPQHLKVKGPQGEEFPATRIQIIAATVRPTEVVLEDGTRLRVTLNVQEVFRSDADDARDNEGRPMYVMTSSNTMVMEEVPANLIGKPRSR